MKLTEDSVKKAEPPEKGQRLIFDSSRGAPAGFGLRITAAGARSFILKYAADGVQRRMTIGQWPSWSVTAARERAAELRRLIDAGIDPLQQKRARQLEPTVAEAAADYMRLHVDHLRSARDVRSYFTRDLIPAIGALKVSDVTRADIRELVRLKADAPRAAAVLLMHAKKFFAWCADTDLIRDDPAASIKLRNIASVPKAKARARVLDDAEIKALWLNAETCGLHRLTALALKLILLVGQRPGEVAGMTWDEVDLAAKVWTIPAARRGKTGTAHAVPLSSSALELLEQARQEVERLAKRRRFTASGHVFQTGPQGALTIYGLDRAVARRRQQLGNRDVPGLGHWRAHDLRRTCRTGLSACGIAEEVAERVVGHTHKGIVAVYNQHRYDAEKRAALELWQRRLLALISGEQPADNVVPLRR